MVSGRVKSPALSVFGQIQDVISEYNNNFFGHLAAAGFDY